MMVSGSNGVSGVRPKLGYGLRVAGHVVKTGPIRNPKSKFPNRNYPHA